ncbi:unnamed protein product [Haemonchus placei]|uniref:Uncharacterized protein n=1 Tax=Haemonchus placei TaxID=6290 RepID=A0A0N4X6I8_HAEPC|nr:unnamed protein product [Haemonchus placei]
MVFRYTSIVYIPLDPSTVKMSRFRGAGIGCRSPFSGATWLRAGFGSG